MFMFGLLLILGCEFQDVKPLALMPNADSRAGNVAQASDYGAALSDILIRVVTADGLVRYDLLRGELSDNFRSVLKAVEDFDATRLLTQDDRLAFWLNAYNVQMLQNIIETPGVANIVDDGFSDQFFRTPYRSARMDVTLDEIENVILRGQSGNERLALFRLARLDARLHAGLNCAAISCPRLRKRAFTGENVQTELDAAMRDFANAPRHFRKEGQQFILSSILDWFGSDFDGQGLPAGDFILQFMAATRPDYEALEALLKGRTAAKIKEDPSVRFEYVWDLNAAPAAK